jgi:nitrite reductase (NADH) small subunit
MNAVPDTAARWIPVCAPEDILPDTGVCALLGDEQVALFRVRGGPHGPADSFFAIGNYDPNSSASVLSRGLIGNLGDRLVVASPIYKQHFDLRTGQCLESVEHSVMPYAVRVSDGQVWLADIDA